MPLSRLVNDKNRTRCEKCPLRNFSHFRKFSKQEIDFVTEFKTGELTVDKGATFLVEGSHSAHLYTMLSGWAFRSKVLQDGRRQILNYALPGDLVGLQGSIVGEMDHSVEALTDITLCVFERSRIMELISGHPDLGYDLIWIAAREERILDEHLLSVGRRTAIERAAYLLSFLYHKVNLLLENDGSKLNLPITQQHVADTLGLSIVHTNKTLKKLAQRGLIQWLDGGCKVKNADGLAEIASWEPEEEGNRPFI